ncbi:hypothetical protein CFT13S00388_02480 [Campylobacter fetus subsp. testudinum]|uniref:hypothetical protein n=1 Tax=Campylobacter fetus TaxID=196 RepID=UPI00081887E9|nr:hypothetical protein [Campylobacter fetus]OCR88054.1 hypothetical protein CFT13S00388_02480 [Campylobacter fetus subsp. testudinum]
MASVTRAQVESLYYELTGLAGDKPGIEYWSNGGLTYAETKKAMLKNLYEIYGTTDKNTIYNLNKGISDKVTRAQVESLYYELTGLAGDKPGIEYWSNGGLTYAETKKAMLKNLYEIYGTTDKNTIYNLKKGIPDTPGSSSGGQTGSVGVLPGQEEVSVTRAQVEALYFELTGFGGDEEGIAYWSNGGLTYAETKKAMLKNLYNTYGTTDKDTIYNYCKDNGFINPQIRQDFVTNIYKELLNRNPTAAELKKWVNTTLSLNDLRGEMLSANSELVKESGANKLNEYLQNSIQVDSNPNGTVSTIYGYSYTPEKRVTLDAKEVTDGDIINKAFDPSWDGVGVFDVFMEALNDNINIQYIKGRIVGEDYATAYTAVLNIALTQAINFLSLNKQLNLQQRELELKEKDFANKVVTDKLQQEALSCTIKVHERQLKGFDDNIMIKLLQAQLEAFGMIYSSGMVEDTNTGPLKASELTAMYNEVKNIAISNKTYQVENRIYKPKSTIII